MSAAIKYKIDFYLHIQTSKSGPGNLSYPLFLHCEYWHVHMTFDKWQSPCQWLGREVKHFLLLILGDAENNSLTGSPTKPGFRLPTDRDFDKNIAHELLACIFSLVYLLVDCGRWATFWKSSPYYHPEGAETSNLALRKEMDPKEQSSQWQALLCCHGKIPPPIHSWRGLIGNNQYLLWWCLGMKWVSPLL